MFGYIRPMKAQLKVGEYESYKAVYCGICRALGKRYGFAARFTVSYDLTFYAALLMALGESPEVRRCRCPACPLKCKNAYTGSDAIDRAADISVVLYYFKLLDKKRDGGFFDRLLFGAGAAILKPSVKKAKLRVADFYRQAEERLDTLTTLEGEGSKSLDWAADTFAALLQAAVPEGLEQEKARPLQVLLYNVGRFIYIADAYDDFTDDIKTGSYNPIAARYGLNCPEMPTEVKNTVDILIKNCENLSMSALSLLELNQYGGIAENIIYLGIPAVWQSLKDGTFYPKKNKRNGRAYERPL